jgi:hypothetical protein
LVPIFGWAVAVWLLSNLFFLLQLSSVVFDLLQRLWLGADELLDEALIKGFGDAVLQEDDAFDDPFYVQLFVHLFMALI